MWKPPVNWRKRLVLLSAISVIGLAGCSVINNEGADNVEDDLNREELTQEIIKLNPLLRNELDGRSMEELQAIYAELQENRQQRKEELLKEIDKDKQINEEDMRHTDNPNPPEPPIYEKPRPVPDPPIEEE